MDGVVDDDDGVGAASRRVPVGEATVREMEGRGERLLGADLGDVVFREELKQLASRAHALQGLSMGQHPGIVQTRALASAVQILMGLLWRRLDEYYPEPSLEEKVGGAGMGMGGGSSCSTSRGRLVVPVGVREEVTRWLQGLDVEFEKVEAMRARYPAGKERDQISALLLPLERGIEEVEAAAKRRM